MKENEWDIKTALAVIMSKGVDSRTWAEAVEWVMLFGPPTLRETIEAASMTATCDCLPEVRAAGINADGEICYDIADLARALGVGEEELGEKINRLQAEKKRRIIFNKDEIGSIQ